MAGRVCLSSVRSPERGQTVEVQGARKITVVILAAVAGLCIAVLLQQAGAYPLDRLATFGLPALVAGIALVVVVRRAGFARAAAEWIAIIIILILVIMAVTGIPALAADGEQGGPTGYLNGGCTVSATSDLDVTTVSDTSRSDPFDIDPDGTVSWEATSGGAIMDHTWEIWVDVGGFPLVVADGGDDNTDGDTTNEGSEPVRPYVDDIGSAIGGDPSGIYLVGGDIAGDGGACDGQAWVRLSGSVLSNFVGQGALGLLVILLIIIVVIIVRTARRTVELLGDDHDMPPPDLPPDPGAMQ